jgi:uncharacterized repeat protein (TIGR01451 family)
MRSLRRLRAAAALTAASTILVLGSAAGDEASGEDAAPAAFSLPNDVGELPRPARRAAPPRTGAKTPAAASAAGAATTVVANKPAFPSPQPSPAPMHDGKIRRTAANGIEIPSVQPTAAPPAGESGKSTAWIRSEIELRQTAAPDILAGAPCPIEIVVTNRGAAPADDVVVAEQIDGALEVVSANPKPEQSGNVVTWTLGRLNPGESKRIEFLVLARSNPGPGLATARASVRFTSAAESRLNLRTPLLEIRTEGAARVVVGQPVEMQIHVANTGAAPATNVHLRNVLSEGLSHPEGDELEYYVGDLAPGESRAIPLVLDSTAVGEQSSRITLQADGLAPLSNEYKVVVDDYRLALSAEGPAVRYLNQASLYQFTVANIGAAATPVADLVVALPESVAFAHASAGGRHTPASRCVAWSVPSLGPGESTTVTVTGIATDIGRQDLLARVEIGGRCIDAETVTTSVKGVAAVNVEVADVTDPVEVGGETIYEIRVANQGTVAQTGVVVTCEIPAEVDAVAADGPVGQKVVGKRLTFDPLAEIAPKSEVLYRVKCRGRSEGQARFKATVKSEEMPSPITKEESTTFFGG